MAVHRCELTYIYRDPSAFALASVMPAAANVRQDLCRESTYSSLVALISLSWKALLPAIFASIAAVEARSYRDILVGKEALLFGAVAHSEDVGIAGPGVLVNNYGALAFTSKARFLGKNAVGPYAKAKDNGSAAIFSPFSSSSASTDFVPSIFYLCICENINVVVLHHIFDLVGVALIKSLPEACVSHFHQSYSFFQGRLICSANSTPIKPPPITAMLSALSSFSSIEAR